MEQNKKDQNLTQRPGKRNEIPERGEKREISSGPRKTTKPEIDLPLKGGRQDSDMASKNQPKRDDVRREDRNDYEKSSR